MSRFSKHCYGNSPRQADQFEKMQDFARAYGALCWNLSKVFFHLQSTTFALSLKHGNVGAEPQVIPRKDLPRIYTMCLPVDGQTTNGTVLWYCAVPRGGCCFSSSNTTSMCLAAMHAGGLGLDDLVEARDAVIEEALAAPERRLDNSLTWLCVAA